MECIPEHQRQVLAPTAWVHPVQRECDASLHRDIPLQLTKSRHKLQSPLHGRDVESLRAKNKAKN